MTPVTLRFENAQFHETAARERLSRRVYISKRRGRPRSESCQRPLHLRHDCEFPLTMSIVPNKFYYLGHQSRQNPSVWGQNCAFTINRWMSTVSKGRVVASQLMNMVRAPDSARFHFLVSSTLVSALSTFLNFFKLSILSGDRCQLD